MTRLELQNRVITDLDEDSSSPTSGLATEVISALDEGQQLIALLTLCLEKTATYTLTAATCWFTPRTSLTDLIVPLRMTISGTRIRPATIAELEAENSAWQATAGTTTRYASLGCNLWAVSPQAAAGSTASVTYAYSPVALTSNSQIPEIPEILHDALPKYGVYRVSLKQGAQQLARGLKYFNEFLDDVQRYGDYVRARSRAARYDCLPVELAKFDRSRMISEVLKWQQKQARA